MHIDNEALAELEVVAAEGYMPSPEMFVKLLADLREARRTMPTIVEVYALAGDATGLWSLDATGPWRSALLLDDCEPDKAAKAVLAGNGVAHAPVSHHTSSRVVIDEEGHSSQIDTFLAVVPVEGSVAEAWPLAEGIDVADLKRWGPPIPHASDAPPVVTDANVLMHGLRHFKWLSNPDNDATRARDLAEFDITPHLEPLADDLARLFRQVHVAA